MKTKTLIRSTAVALTLGSAAMLAAHSADAMCKRDQDCRKDPPDPAPPKSRAHGTVYPAYYVLTLLYAPPGNQSTVEYAGGSTTGSETDISNSFKGGPQITAKVGIVEATVGWQGGGTTGSTFETSKETTKTLGLGSQVDATNHDYDTFYVWTNPQMNADQTGDNAWSMGLTVKSGEAMSVIPVSVKELKNPSTMAAFKQKALAALKPSDFAQILSLDPFANGATGFASSRFTKVDSLQLDGPFEPGAPLNPQGLEISNEQVNGSVGGFVSTVTTSVMVGTGFNFFGLLKDELQAGGTFEWDYQKTTTKKTGQSQSASVTLQTSSVGYNDVVDVYYDSVFKSFAFASELAPQAPRSAQVSGVVLKDGKPSAKQLVTVAMPNGQKRRVVTNAKGEYRLFNLPAGAHRVTVAGKSETVDVRAGKTINVQHRTL